MMNISVTPQQSEYVRRTVEREFGNSPESFRDLIRERMRGEMEADVRLLVSSGQGAPAGPSEPQIEEVLKLQRQVRKELKSAGRV